MARRDRINPARSLNAELSRRKRRGETLFEYSVSSYVEVKKVDGKMVNTKRPLLFSYVFVRSSVEEIFQMEHTPPLYNFLPRVSPEGMIYFPYLSDDEMGNSCQVAESCSNESPAHVSDSGCLLEGDRVRITPGYSTGMEMKVAIQSGGGRKGVVARVLDRMWIPLLGAKPGGYELVELDTKGKYVYTHLDNDRLWESLHDTLGRYHASGNASERGTRLARGVLRSYGSLRAETDVMRCRIYSLPLSVYKLLGNEEEFTRLYDTMRGILLMVKAPRSRALLLATLYGCTDSVLYRQVVHEVVDPWQGESLPKKSKLSLTRRLDDYDGWFGHEIS